MFKNMSIRHANCRFLIAKWDKAQKFATIMYETLESTDAQRNIWRQVAVWMLVPLLYCHVLIMLAYGEQFMEPEFSWSENRDEEYDMPCRFRTPQLVGMGADMRAGICTDRA